MLISIMSTNFTNNIENYNHVKSFKYEHNTDTHSLYSLIKHHIFFLKIEAYK